MIKISGRGEFNLAYQRDFSPTLTDPTPGGPAGVLVTIYPQMHLVIKAETPDGLKTITFQGTLLPLPEGSKILEVASLVDGCVSARDIEAIIAENERLCSVIRTLEAENTALRREFVAAIKEGDL